MTKKPFKVMTTAAMAAAFSASAIVPTAVMAAETPADSLSVAEYILENDGKLYTVTVEEFGELKGAGIKFSTPKYVKASNGNVYNLDDYLEAKAALQDGPMAETLEVLEENEDPVEDLSYGEVDGVDEDGNPIFKDPETDENEELAEAIEAAETAIADLPAVEDLTLEDKEAVDTAQALVDAALELDEDAEIEGLDALVAAQDKIAELEEEAEVEELTVESVSAINTTGVTVVVTELTEDIEGATVEVKDSEGNVVEVEAVDLSAGETTIDFAFATEVKEEDLTGVWTVDSVEFNLGLALLLEKFAETDSQIELYEVLEELGIENLDSANIAAYLNEKQDLLDDLAAEEEEVTKEIIQTFVNDVNESVLTDEEKEAAAQAVVKALGNNIKLKDALNNSAFKYVNNDWLEGNSGYAAALEAADFDVDEVTSEDIQDVIDNVNNIKINAEYGKLAGAPVSLTEVDKEKLTKVKALIETYAATNDEGNFVNTGFKTNLEKINEQIAVSDVLAATTASKFKATVNVLANLVDNKDTLDMEDYVDANGKAYIDYIKEQIEDEVSVNSTTDIVNAIDQVNKDVVANNAIELFEALGKAIENLENKETATTKAKFVKALQDLSLKQVSSNTDNVSEYKEKLSAIEAEVEKVTGIAEDGSDANAEESDDAVDAIQAIIDQANIDVVKAAEKDDIIAALEVIGTKNLVESNAAKYATATNSTNTKELIQTAIDNVNTVAAIEAAVEGINKAETASEVKTELDVLSNNELIPAYLNVTSADRIFIAEKVLEERDELKADRNPDAKAKEYTGHQEVSNTVDGAIQDRTDAIAAVNAITEELASEETEIITVDSAEIEAVEEEVVTGYTVTADKVADVEEADVKITDNDSVVYEGSINLSGDTPTLEISLADDLDGTELTEAATIEITYTAKAENAKIEADKDDVVTGQKVTANQVAGVTNATVTITLNGEEVETGTIDLSQEEPSASFNDLVEGDYGVEITYTKVTQGANDLTTIANALLLVGHESLSKDTPAANTVVAEKFFDKLTFDEYGDIKPKFQSISSIRTVLDGLK